MICVHSCTATFRLVSLPVASSFPSARRFCFPPPSLWCRPPRPPPRFPLFASVEHRIGRCTRLLRRRETTKDFVQEGTNAERVARMFRDNPNVFVPGIHWDLSSRRVRSPRIKKRGGPMYFYHVQCIRASLLFRRFGAGGACPAVGVCTKIAHSQHFAEGVCRCREVCRGFFLCCRFGLPPES